jgi:DnaK suppressor protein
MEEHDLKYFKNLLENLLEDLLEQAKETVSGMLESEENAPDPLDRATADAEYSFKMRIRGRESTLIRKIRNSLEDIENGVYGICEDCEEEISIARLKARPVASRCITCKTKQERREKVYSY